MVLDELGKKTNTVIEMIYVPSADRNTKLSTMVAGGTPPDIFGTDANTAKEFKEAGLLAEVGKYLNTLGPNILADAGDILSACPVNKDGIYMILSGSMGGADQLNLRTDWLKNLGLEMPTDLDSLYNVFYAFTYKDPNGSGKQDTYGLAAQTNLRSFSTIFGAYGIPQSATIIKDDNTLTTWVKHPQFLDAITYIRKLIADGLVEPDWATIPQMDMFGKLWNGVAGAMEWECVGPTNNWMPARYTEPVPPTFGFPIIRGPQGKHGVPKVFQSVTGGYVISSKADVEAALRIADYCKTPEASDLLYLGVEGVMYQWTDKANGKFEYLGDYADASTHRAAGGFCYWDLFVPANNAQLRTLNKQTQDGVAQAYAEGLDNTALIVADLRTRIDYGADMDQVIREMYAELLTTRGNLQTVYNRYMREWESAGGAEWEKEVNEAWKAQGGKNS
jgi:putative aldouronate transport system substrate-binding protein